MATEELKIIITADNKDAVDKLVQAINATQKFGDTLKNTAKPTADATNALSNLSRVAQDAPYGFMGIANNLNPLLESFQRLSKETGSSTSALKSMAAGLMGPAGIGLALGAVSSLFVAFGGDIVNFINGTDEAKKAQDEFNKSLEQAKQKAAEQATSLNLLIAVANSANASDEQRAKALNAVKEAIGKVNQDYASQIRTVADATEAVNLYTQALIQQAIVQRYQDKIADKTIELTNLTKEVAKATIEYSEAQKRAASMTNGYVDASVVQAGVIGSAKGKLEDATIAYNNTSDAIKELNNDLKVTTEEAVKMPFFTDLLLGKTASVKTPATKAVKEKDYSLQDNIAALENDIKATNKWADEQMKIYDKMYNFYKKYGDAVKAVTNVSSTRDMIQDQDKRREKQEEKIPISERKIEIPPNIKMMEQGIKKFDKELKDSQETMQKYAEFMASTLTDGIMVMFDAFASGENPLEALGNFVGDLVRKLAEAAIQAAILQGIMMLLPGGAASAAAGGGFFGSFKKILGMAEGGIVSRPTIAMVGEGGQSEAIMPLNKLGNMMNSTFAAGAMSGTGGGSGQFVLKGNDLVLALQRSNYSLNLRRGNGI
jgi:vacuolar-type H+-ATPase subunit E/Vma4